MGAELDAESRRTVISSSASARSNTTQQVRESMRSEGTVLGRNVVVESNAVVEAAEIGEGTVIEVGAVIGRGSIIGKVWWHASFFLAALFITVDSVCVQVAELYSVVLHDNVCVVSSSQHAFAGLYGCVWRLAAAYRSYVAASAGDSACEDGGACEAVGYV